MRKLQTAGSAFAKGALTLALVVGLAPTLPATAFADEEGFSAADALMANATVHLGTSAFDYPDAESSLSAMANADYPETFDLRDRGIVTSVKMQNPWGSCWAFAATAAAETSILSEAGTTAEESGLDLSEHHLAWFAKSHIAVEGEEGYDAENTQAGEGIWTTTPEKRMNGGNFYMSTNAYASGLGPVIESADAQFEYHGLLGLVQAFKTLEGQQQELDGVTFDEAVAQGYTPRNYSEQDDWSIDYSKRYTQSYELQESYVLPTPYDKEGNFTQASVDAVKEQLVAGRGVEAGFCADTSKPTEDPSSDKAQYINTNTWAHYTWKQTSMNHAVCIVGWDDNYSKENFRTWAYKLDKDGNVVTDAEGNPVYDSDCTLPAGDGAWIAKNSWGSGSEEFPNKRSWGVDEDGDGEGDGYFYLSYYDKSISMLEALDFYTDDYWTGSVDGYYMAEYDLAPATSVATIDNPKKTSFANVFESDLASALRSVSCFTATPGTTVDYEVYLVDDTTKASPTDGKLVAQGSQTFELGGFHHLDLTSPVLLAEGQAFAVVETCSYVSNGETVYYVPAPYAATEKLSPSSYVKMVVNEGESLIGTFDGEKTNWADGDWAQKRNEIMGELSEYFGTDNLPIKAYLDDSVGISFDANGGSGTMDCVLTIDGSKVTVPECAFEAPEGMKFAGWKNDEDVVLSGAELTLTESITLTAQWEAVFPDVAEDQWFTESVYQSSLLGLFKGYNDGTFGPNDTLTRAQVATILWRYVAGSVGDGSVNTTGMTDVEVNQYYTAAANWAVENRIINGKSDGKGGRIFDPSGAVTAEQLCVILSNAAKATPPESTTRIDALADGSAISSWARNACEWAMEQDVMHGYEADGVRTLRPQEGVSRARAATLLVNAVQKGVLTKE